MTVKENLVLVHSFPTNSILLAGLVEFLGDYFEVHFIDLPGFTRRVKPLRRPTIEGFATHLEERIAELGLARYVLGGISFGYLVVSHARVDSRCRAILALEPFLGIRSLYMKGPKRLFAASFARAVASLGLGSTIFGSRRWRQRLLRRGYPEERVDVMCREIDARTFFATAALLATHCAPLRFHPLPLVLMVNHEDRTINAEDVAAVFAAHVDDLLVVETTVDHYPRTPDKDYFRKHVPPDRLADVLRFLERL